MTIDRNERLSFLGDVKDLKSVEESEYEAQQRLRREMEKADRMLAAKEVDERRLR